MNRKMNKTVYAITAAALFAFMATAAFAAPSAKYDAKAMIGHGSLTVEEVRATNNPDGVSFDFAY